MSAIRLVKPQTPIAKQPIIVAAIIGTTGTIIVASLNLVVPLYAHHPAPLPGISDAVRPLPAPVLPAEQRFTAHPVPHPQREEPLESTVTSDRTLVGQVLNLAGAPISRIEVGLDGGQTCITDDMGTFILKDLPVGLQRFTLQPNAVRRGHADQFIDIKPKGTTMASLVYNLEKSTVGLLSVTFPLSNGDWPVEFRKGAFIAEVRGRCDGLSSQYKNIAIWPVVHSANDGGYWIQPRANIDFTTGEWTATVYVGQAGGDRDKLPQVGELWTITAVVGEADCGINDYVATGTSVTHLSDLKLKFATSNIITLRLKPQH